MVTKHLELVINTYRILNDGEVEPPGALERQHGLGVGGPRGELGPVDGDDAVADLQPRLPSQPALPHGLDVNTGVPSRAATDTTTHRMIDCLWSFGLPIYANFDQ